MIRLWSNEASKHAHCSSKFGKLPWIGMQEGNKCHSGHKRVDEVSSSFIWWLQNCLEGCQGTQKAGVGFLCYLQSQISHSTSPSLTSLLVLVWETLKWGYPGSSGPWFSSGMEYRKLVFFWFFLSSVVCPPLKFFFGIYSFENHISQGKA